MGEKEGVVGVTKSVRPVVFRWEGAIGGEDVIYYGGAPVACVGKLSGGARDTAVENVEVVQVAEIQEPGGAGADPGIKGGAACASVVKGGRLGANPSVEVPTNKCTLLGREFGDKLFNLGAGIRLLDVLSDK